MKQIKVHYIRDVEKIEKIEKGDWVDLRAGIDMKLTKGQFAVIPLGVSMKLPVGYEGILAPRSSTFKHWGILQVNSIGVFDESYCGTDDEWLMAVYATRDTEIKKNDRICQFRIIKHQPELDFVEADKLEATNRGGFGSTGRV